LLKRGLFLLLFVFIAGIAGAAETAQARVKVFPDPDKFPMPDAYQPNVEFWTRVYGEWSDSQAAIHDMRYINLVLAVVDMPDKNGLLAEAARSTLVKRVAEIKKVLTDLDKDTNAPALSAEHKRIYDLYKGIYDPSKFKLAAENLRIQYGIKNRFGKGLGLMTLYVDQIKTICREEGVPEEIAYLPLVESSFNNSSLSKTRAAGIYQFMATTGRTYGLTINDSIDQRLDPFAASRAAARYLKRSHSMFGNWPLAIMSYNHGQQGISRAVHEVGSDDFMTILNNYRGRVFGFASQNFYAEFLAACKVMNDAEKYFGKIDYSKPLEFDSIKLGSSLPVATLLSKADLSREELRQFNPSLSSSVIFGKRSIPAGFELRLPVGKIPDPGAFVAGLHAAQKPVQEATLLKTVPATASSTHNTYTVRRGDTLYSISRMFSTTVDEIRKLNGLVHNNIIPGQRLTVSSR
jgi:membrane-bound lytic murein transglycosylase D